MLTLAISKGRLLRQTLPLLSAIGCAPSQDPDHSRSLILPTQDAQTRLIIVRAQDAPTYVSCGAADAGIVGGDVVAENPSQDIYQPLALPISQCRLVAAGRQADILQNPQRQLTVAAKYVNLARAYFLRAGLRARVIKLHGGLELAPLVNLSDVIVDLAESGETLRANGLIELAIIRRFSAALIINRVSARRNPQTLRLQNALAAAAAGRRHAPRLLRLTRLRPCHPPPPCCVA